MLVVETIAKIRLAYFSRKMTIKAICRDLRVSRKVVRKVIRSQATEFHYQRDVQPQPKIGPWRERLDSLLLENDGKPARERLTLIRVFEELRGLGYEGGYDTVRRYARAWSKERASETASAYVPLSFAPGEAYQFDWSHDIVVMDGVTTTVKAAHVRLCHSRMMLVRGRSHSSGAPARAASPEAACLQALSDGVHSADVIINILARQRDPGPAATIMTPDALRLRHAPIADCARYDQLRSA
jgi:hypothetical protein